MPTNLHQAFKSKAIGILMASTVLVTSSLAIAEDSGQNILSGSKAANSNEVLPNLQASANLTTPDGRNITIHREAQTGAARSSAIYFHRPLFAFVPNPDTQNTDHSILWDKVEEEGHMYVKLKLVLSTPEFRELARAAVIEDDPSIFADKQGIKERDIDVRPWPLKLLRLSAKNGLTGRTYGESLPESLRTAGDQIDVNLKIPTDKYDDFLNKLQNNRIKFSPSYTFSNSIVAFAQSATTISSDVTVTIDQALQTIQADEGQPIFQDDVRKLKNLLRQEITSTIRATDSQVLAHVTPHDISSQILKPTEVKFSTLDGNKDLLAKVEAYLAPIVRKMGQDNTDTKEKNDTTVDTQKQKLKLGASAATGASGSIELDKEQVKTLEKKHKVILTQSEDKNVIEPHSIEINYVREGWQSSLVDIFKTVYLSTGRDGSFQTDSPVLSSFTIDKLNEAIGNETIVISPYNRVPRGVPMLSFRADIPKRLDCVRW